MSCQLKLRRLHRYYPSQSERTGAVRCQNTARLPSSRHRIPQLRGILQLP